MTQITEGEAYVLWMLRVMSQPDGAGFQVTAAPGKVSLVLPATETGRPDDLVGEGADVSEAYTNLMAAPAARSIGAARD